MYLREDMGSDRKQLSDRLAARERCGKYASCGVQRYRK
jgi:hypothetical protein